MKIFAVAICLVLTGCCYAPTYAVVKDSYNTYAPVYAPSSAPVYAPVYAPVRTTYPAYPQNVRQVRRIIILRRPGR